jgi:hypothetical protein
MARVKLSPLLTDISGSIGGMTIQRNKFGVTLRQKPIPLNKITPAQVTIRAHIATIQAAWQELTDAQRLQWNRFLDFSGQTIRKDRSVKLSGHSLYLKYQLYRLLTGMSLLTTLTYVPMPAVSEVVGFTVAADSLQLEVSPSVDHTKLFFMFFISNPRHENRAPSRHGLRYMDTTIATGTVFQIKEAYKDAFGILPAVDTWAHYSIQFFSVLAPVYSGIVHGKYIIEA